jgi:hypothetical protein
MWEEKSMASFGLLLVNWRRKRNRNEAGNNSHQDHLGTKSDIAGAEGI